MTGTPSADAAPPVRNDGDGGDRIRYANQGGALVRVDPHAILSRTVADGGRVVRFGAAEWDGTALREPQEFVTAIYPDYKPAPFIVSSAVDGLDMVTVVTEGIFSYCGAKVKIDTDRHIGPERALIRAEGEPVGHVSSSEYGSQMLPLGGVHHLTGGTKKEGRATCDAMLALCNGAAVELAVDGGATVLVQAGQPPVVNGQVEERMRVGCGSATVGMFAKQWEGRVDEVVVGTTTSPASCRNTRPASSWASRGPASGSRAAGPRRAAVSRWRSRGRAGAARTSLIRLRSSARSTRRRRVRA